MVQPSPAHPHLMNAAHVALIGAGPAGLAAAEVLAAGGAHVTLFDAMPSVGRKFLLAGRGGLNLTHAEPLEPFLGRYGVACCSCDTRARAATRGWTGWHR